MGLQIMSMDEFRKHLAEQEAKKREDNPEYAKISDTLDKYNMKVSDMYFTDRRVVIELSGDWKHAHLRLDNIMFSIGYEKTRETSIGSMDSDYYTAEHAYKRIS